jgi:hypothetical protein
MELQIVGALLEVVFTAMGEKVWGATGPRVFRRTDCLSSFRESIFSLDMSSQRATACSASKERSSKAIKTSAVLSCQHALRLPTMCRGFCLLLQKS